MGLTQSVTPEQQLANINKLHENIELVMKLNPNKLSRENEKFIETTYRSLMRCTFFPQVTEALLLDRLNKHIDKWSELNETKINKDKYVVEKYSHMKKFLSIYLYYVMRTYDD
jgi:hypothetical protein